MSIKCAMFNQNFVTATGTEKNPPKNNQNPVFLSAVLQSFPRNTSFVLIYRLQDIKTLARKNSKLDKKIFGIFEHVLML